MFSKMTEELEMFLQYLRSEKGCSSLTILAYQDDLTRFIRFCEETDVAIRWDSVDADLVRKWVARRMGAGASPRTVKRGLSSLRGLFRYLLMIKRIRINPMAKVKNPKAGKSLPVFLNQSEMDRLFDVVIYPDTYEGRLSRLVLLTFYSTGVRMSELLNLKTADVDCGKGELKVLGKRNKERLIPFGEELKTALSAYIGIKESLHEADSEKLFTFENGKPLKAAWVRAVVKKYLSMVTLQQRVYPHVLRHTFATVMLNNGADLEAVKDLLGHESLATTEVYTHATFAELKEQYKHAHPRV